MEVVGIPGGVSFDFSAEDKLQEVKEYCEKKIKEIIELEHDLDDARDLAERAAYAIFRDNLIEILNIINKEEDDA